MGLNIRITNATFTRTGLQTLFSPLLAFGSNLITWVRPDVGQVTGTVSGESGTRLLSIADQSGYGNNMTAPSGAEPAYLVPSPSRPYFVNDGTTERFLEGLTNPFSAPWTQATPFTVAAVFKREASGTFIDILLGAFSSDTNVRGWFVPFSGATGPIGLSICNVLNSSELRCYGNQGLTVGKTYAVVITYSGSVTAAGINIYVNGVQQTVTASINNIGSSTISSTAPLGIGSNAVNDIYEINDHGETLLLNRVATPAECAALSSYLMGQWGIS
jgi:hypothetical protein